MALPFLNKMLVPPFPNEVLPRPLPARSPSKNNIKIIIVRPKVEARDHARSRCQPRDTSKDTGTYTRRVDDTQPTSCSPDHSVQSEARRDPIPGRGFALAIHSPGTTNLATPSLFSSSLKLQSLQGPSMTSLRKGPPSDSRPRRRSPERKPPRKRREQKFTPCISSLQVIRCILFCTYPTVDVRTLVSLPRGRPFPDPAAPSRLSAPDPVLLDPVPWHSPMAYLLSDFELSPLSTNPSRPSKRRQT